MKKSFIIHAISLLIGMSIPLCTMSQTSVVVNQPIDKTIVSTLIKERPGSYPATITCANIENGTVSFFLCNNSQSSQEAVLKDYVVNDMYVIKDTVFFCGKTFGGDSKGVIGFFRINDVFSGSGSIYTQDYFAYDTAHIANNFTRMEVYMNKYNQRCIVCVGTCGDKNYPCMVNMNPAPMAGYTMGYIHDAKESLYDVKIFDTGSERYLITAGFDMSTGKYVSLRKYKADNPFIASGPQDIRYTFNSNNSGIRIWDGEEVLIQQFDDSIFSTVSYRRASSNSDTTDCGVHVGFYSLPRLHSGSTTAMVDQLEISMFTTSNRKMSQYIKNQGHTLVFLHTFTTTPIVITRSFFCELYYPSIGNPGALREYYHPENLYQGMTVYHNNTQYAMSGYYRLATGLLRYELDTYGNNPTCARLHSHNYTQYEPITNGEYAEKFNIMSGIELLTIHRPGLDEFPLDIICTEQ